MTASRSCRFVEPTATNGALEQLIELVAMVTEIALTCDRLNLFNGDVGGGDYSVCPLTVG